VKLLIIEDEKALLDSIVKYFQGEKYVCEVASTYMAALEKVDLYDYDCILLDISLPDGTGLEILKELRENNKADGVLIISARNSVDDKITGLNLGADDYLAKPFHLPELAARVASVIRRKSFAGSSLIQLNEITIDTQAKSVSVNNRPIDLTPKEFHLLLYFVSNRGKVISKNAIAEHLWGDDMDMANNFDFLYSHIKNLRKKLADAGCAEYIQSVYSMGYKFKTA